MTDFQIINKIKELGKRILPKDALFILFGSRTRKDARKDSDWDTLVVLNKEGTISQSDYDNYSDPFSVLG